MTPRPTLCLLACLAAAYAVTIATAATQSEYDLLIRNATVVDGTGAIPFRGDVAVIGDRIAAIGFLDAAHARQVIDAKGRYLTPGFIDVHAHLDDAGNKKKTLRSPDARYRAAQNYVMQGVTTAFVNPDGGQPASLVDQRRELQQLGIGVNVALANGHATLRRQVMGKDTARPANAEEIARMQAILVRGLTEEGSFGLSLGLEYNSGLYSDTNELRELARVLPAHNGVFIAHLRSQGSAPMWYKPSVHGARPPPTLETSLTEIFEVARETGALVVATHLKGWGPGFRGEAARTVARINEARAKGARVFADLYPYDSAGSDGNFVALPPWAMKGGNAKTGNEDDEDDPKAADFQAGLRRTLANAERLPDLRRDVEHQVDLKGGAENIRVLEYPDASYVGKSLGELMRMRKLGLTELVVALQLEGFAHRPGGVKLRAFSMEEKDVEMLLTQPWCMGSTDGWIVLPEEAVGPLKYIGTNRRCFGSYPRRLAHFVRDQKIETIEETVRKCTSLPAHILNLPDRGTLAVGYKADLVLIDLPNVKDNTTFLEPNEYPTGIDAVFVNGVAVVESGRPTLALPGRVLEPVQVRR